MSKKEKKWLKKEKKIINFLNFNQIRFEPPENENRKVPLIKGGASPTMPPPRNKKNNDEKGRSLFRYYCIRKLLLET